MVLALENAGIVVLIISFLVQTYWFFSRFRIKQWMLRFDWSWRPRVFGESLTEQPQRSKHLAQAWEGYVKIYQHERV